MKIKLISTFSDKGYHDYAKNFVESCFKHIKDVDVVIYKDTIDIKNKENVSFLPLEDSCPNLVNFKKRNSDKNFKDFKFDGVRFSHKVYATIHASRENNLDYLIWLDADTEIYDTVDPAYFLKFLPKGKFVGYVGRDTASETGFLMFDMKHPEAKNFFDRYEWYYNSDAIYNLEQYHDGFVFDVVRKEFEIDRRIFSHSVSPPGVTKQHFNAAFDGYMMHYKGEGKEKREKLIAKAMRRKGKQ
jgi:hypothetical protein